MSKILIIEDNRDILYSNRTMLELKGYEVLSAETLAAGRRLLEQYNNITLILLDIMLPDGNGLDLCRELRADRDIKILFLSALNERGDVIEGLRAGGDDYLGKPYLMEELLLRVEALLRRRTEVAAGERFGDLEFHNYTFSVSCGGRDLNLRLKEYSVLRFLCDRAGTYVTARDIFQAVWGIPDAENDVLQPVYNCISVLKEKLKSSSVKIGYVRNVGYSIAENE